MSDKWLNKLTNDLVKVGLNEQRAEQGTDNFNEEQKQMDEERGQTARERMRRFWAKKTFRMCNNYNLTMPLNEEK